MTDLRQPSRPTPLKTAYQVAIRPILFSVLKTDPEWLHQQALRLLAWLGQPLPSQGTSSPQSLRSGLQTTVSQTYQFEHARLHQTLWDLPFPNPMGIAAGFDKDGLAVRAWPLLGFGFAELGTVTFHAQPGNPKPRLFRLPQDRAVLNRMGFNNQGAAALAFQLKDVWQRRPIIPIGINLGKSKIAPLEEAAEDYLRSFQILYPYGDYFVVNVSSPNTPGLRSLQAADQLAPILAALQQINTAQKPLLVKISPDLDEAAIEAVLATAQTHQLAGIIATNTTIQRHGLTTRILPQTGRPLQEEAGGISGAPLTQRSTEVIRHIYRQTGGSLPIIGVGGIFSAADAWAKITAGASLLQIYTGWIYQGPWLVRDILVGLLEKLDEYGLETLTDAIGLDHR